MSAASGPLTPETGERFAPDRRRVLVGVVRAVSNAVVLVMLYALLPLDQPVGPATIGWLLIGLLTFAVLVVLQLRSIVRAGNPGLRAVEALGAAVPMFVLVFASTYLLLASSEPQAFTEALSHTDALYFTMTVFSTVGFGDIVPQSETARVIVTGQMVGNLIVLASLGRVVVGAVRIGWKRQTGGAAAAPRAPSRDGHGLTPGGTAPGR